MIRNSLAPTVLIALCLAGCSTESKPAPAEQPEATAAKDIQTLVVKYQAGGTECHGYLAWDARQQDPRPGVLVVHEWWGHNEYAQRRARMLAEAGYTALALDMYGEGKTAEHPKDANRFMTETLANMDAAVVRFKAARKLLEEHASTDPSKTAAIGYCFGGGVVLGMARMGMDLDAVCSFHGSLKTDKPAKPGTVKARIFVAHGEADAMVSAEDVAAFKAEMQAAGVTPEFLSYKGAKHGFTNPEADAKAKQFEIPLGYDKAADEDSWAKLKAFLAASFG